MEKNLRQKSTEIMKIVVFDPESTGKTTLAKNLAKYFNTIWVSEFTRDYLQKKWNNTSETCKEEDLLSIAIEQIKLENEALEKANKYLFFDTNLLTTKAYSEIYYGCCEVILEKAAEKHEYDLIFLTIIDVPREKDNLRGNSKERNKELEKTKEALVANEKPFIFFSGNQEERLDKAVAIVKSFTKAKKMGFSSKDYVKIYNYGISVENIENHLKALKKGIIKSKLEKSATIGNGIIELSESQVAHFVTYFDAEKEKYKIKKFVPASGAASRMFSSLITFLNEFQVGKETLNAYINRKKETFLPVLFIGIDRLPFYNEALTMVRAIYPDYDTWNHDFKIFYLVEIILSPKYLDYANKPKGVLPFHKYGDRLVTPIEEHLKESVYYANTNTISYLHFSISQNHHKDFEEIINKVKTEIEKRTKVVFEINFSYQKRETDTVAFDFHNNPLRDEKGQIVFRQSGHGALIENLKNLDADIIFIKNIDNVIHNNVVTIVHYKKCLAGILIQLQKKIFHYISLLDKEEITEQTLLEIIAYCSDKLNIKMPITFSKFTLENRISYLKEQLDRPVRVCGMVKNEGEPGGGPFWVRDCDGNISLQIVETSQVDSNNHEQVQILEQSTHFNPVDLVCGIRNNQGERFDLDQFIDHNSGFIVYKNKNGKELQSYELPGLWNGSMSKWITVFVEVPLITFNPVKTINDLLKPSHQSS